MSPLGDEPTAAAHNRVVIAKGKLKVVAFPVGTLDIFPHCLIPKCYPAIITLSDITVIVICCCLKICVGFL